MPAFRLLGLLLWSGLVCASLRADDWPQWGGPQRDCVWRETGIVRKFKLPAAEKPKSEVKAKGKKKAGPADEEAAALPLLPRVWSTPLGEGYAGPAVAGDKVYVTDLVDRRMARGQERVLCLDATTGRVLWKHEYDVQYDISYPAGPRATPVVDGDRVYTIGATGRMFCFRTGNGEILWESDFQNDFQTKLPTWGMAASPLVVGQQLVTLVGGEDGALVVSFDKETGEVNWRALSDPQIGYAPPMLFKFGGEPQLVIWHPEAVTGLDPASGSKLWEVPFAVQAGLCVPTPQLSGDRLFLTSFYNGSRMIEIDPTQKPMAKLVWRGKSDSERETDGLHAIMATPYVTPTHIYGVCSYGQLRCLDAKTGERVWETFDATGEGRWWNAFLIPNGDVVFLHNEQGDLIIAELSPAGYKELSRAKLVEPTRPVQRRMTIWSHPAFAQKSVFARNDKELVRVNLAE